MNTASAVDLPETFHLHDWRASKINNDLDAKENPVEVSANTRNRAPGCTMMRYGRRRKDAAVKLAADGAERIGIPCLRCGRSSLLVTWLLTSQG